MIKEKLLEATVYSRVCKRCKRKFNTKAFCKRPICDNCNLNFKNKNKERNYLSNEVK
jgi:hypothetical protein